MKHRLHRASIRACNSGRSDRLSVSVWSDVHSLVPCPVERACQTQVFPSDNVQMHMTHMTMELWMVNCCDLGRLSHFSASRSFSGRSTVDRLLRRLASCRGEHANHRRGGPQGIHTWPSCKRSDRTLLGAPGIATRNKDATSGGWPYY